VNLVRTVTLEKLDRRENLVLQDLKALLGQKALAARKETLASME